MFIYHLQEFFIFFIGKKCEYINKHQKDSKPLYTGGIQWAPKGATKKERTQKTTPSLNENPTNLQNQIKM